MQSDKSNIKVSIVIPFYNVEKYIQESLDSVISQSLKDIEIICVNDGSTDNSLEIVNEFATKDNRIRICNLPNNCGVSAARNAGVKIARGEFIYFLDSDDTVSKDAMEDLYLKATKDNLDLICFEGDTVFSSDELKKRRKADRKWCVRNKEYTGIKTGKQLMTEMYDNNDYKAVIWILFIRRDFYIRENLGFDSQMVAYGDNLFTFKCMLMAKRACHVYKKYYLRKVREDSITSTKIRTIKHPYCFFRCALKMGEIVSNMELTTHEYETVNKEIRRMLNAAKDELSGLNSEEIGKYHAFPMTERIAFEHLVVNRILDDQEKDSLKKEIKSIKKSISFKIGRIISWLPRKLTGSK